MNNVSKIRIKYIVLFILILICAYSIGLTNSRYVSESNYNNNLEIAKPIIEIESDSNKKIENMLPGDTAEYIFNVKNTDNTNKNEIMLNYYIKVVIPENGIPLTYKIYDITNGTEKEININSNKTDLISLGFENIENHKYKIKFIWPKDKKDYSYANKDMKFDIEVYAEQAL